MAVETTDPRLSDKQIATEAVANLPESATLEEISEELAILTAIRRGEIAVERGEIVSHEEVKRRSATWTERN